MKKIIVVSVILIFILTAALSTACSHGGGPSDVDGTSTEATSAPEAVTTATDGTPAKVTGWFDYGSALYKRDTFTPGNRESIEFQMAKNEIEGFQYLLTSDADVDGLRCDVTPLSDGQGHVIDGTVNVVRYLWVDKADGISEIFTWYPVFMLPMDDEYQGGSFDVAADTCRTLYISYRTDADTVPGTYTGKLSVSKNGDELLSGDVSLRVRDIFYDDKTECLTMVGLGYDKEDGDPYTPAGPESAPAMGTQHGLGFANPELTLEYARFLFENRLCATYLPFPDDLLNEDFDMVKDYLNNPRFTGANLRRPYVKTGDDVASISDSAYATMLAKEYQTAVENGWENKLYFAGFDEPHVEEQFQVIINNAAWVKRYFPSAKFLDAFGINLTLDGRNVVERMSDYTTAYCPVINVFKGELKDSLLKLKHERGDTLFWYTCGVPNPDGNRVVDFMPVIPGTTKRLMFWQQYQQDVDGFLYWSITHWNCCYDVWADDYMETDFKFPKSDAMPTDAGVLIYWHPVTKKPVTTLGFEAMRDGIEDFQLFKTAERKLGREKVLEYVEQLTTDINQYVRYEDGSTELLNNLKNQVFDLLESA
ncbi:MAG: DUF4091 domain-containing protein [Clostridia bacterium]|nr:DUF4091 domain-containing protein [Clostridia bacterium]